MKRLMLLLLMLVATPAWGITLPTLPQAQVDVTMPTVNGTTFNATCATFQAQLNAAAASNLNLTHQVVLGPAGVTCTGAFILPAHNGGTGWILVTGPNGGIVAPGTRQSLANISQMPKLKYGNSPFNGTVLAATNAKRYRFIGIEFVQNDSFNPNYSFLITGYNDAGTNTGYFIVDRCVFHTTTTAVNVKNGWWADADQGNTALIESYIDGINVQLNQGDSHGFLAITNPGPILLRNNFLRDSTENIHFCGADPAGITVNQTNLPKDITIIRNEVTKNPLISAATGWASKTLLELKCGLRTLVEGNTFYGMANDQGDVAFRLTPRNDAGTNPNFMEISDLTIRYNLIYNVVRWINSMGSDDGSVTPGTFPTSGSYSNHTKRWDIHDNLVYGLDYGCQGSDNCGRVYQIANGGFLTNCYDFVTTCQPEDLSFHHNTIDNVGSFLLYTSTPGSLRLDFRDNLISAGGLGTGYIRTDAVSTTYNPVTALTNTWGSTWALHHNIMAALSSDHVGEMPQAASCALCTSNVYPTTASTIQWTNQATRDYTLQAGSPAKNAASDGRDMGVNFAAYNAAQGGTITPSCTGASPTWTTTPDQASVQTCVNSAGDGDTVNVLAGSATWNTRVTVTNKSLVLLGAGIGNTIITGNDGSAGGGCALRLITKATGNTPVGFTRISGFEFNCTVAAPGVSGGYAGGGIVTFEGFSANVRFDHNKLTTTNTSGLFAQSGAVKGVADHNTFINNGNLIHIAIWQHTNWTGAEVGPLWPAEVGDTSWASPDSYGTSDNFYFEDNTITNTFGSNGDPCSDDHGGSRTVYRFNTLTNCVLHSHGTDTSGRGRGSRHREIYRNTANYNLASNPTFINNRGGTGMYFDNTTTGNYSTTYGLVALDSLRRNDTIDVHSDGSTPFGRCGTFTATAATRTFAAGIVTVTLTFPVGAVYSYSSNPDIYVSYETISGASPAAYNGTFPTAGIPGNTTQIKYKVTSASDPGPFTVMPTMRSPFDGNTNATGYRCLDQAGAGQSIQYFGYQSTFPPDINPLSAANNALLPVLSFNNTLGGTLNLINSAFGIDNLDILVENRDFYNQNNAFNGTAGIGRGAGSSKPATCTTGVYYWATDEGNWNTGGAGGQGRLYRCAATNAWSLYYTPYAYPHPLQSGIAIPPTAPAPPTGLTVQ